MAAHRGAASPAAGKGRERDRPPRASRWSQQAHTMTFAPGDPAGTPDQHTVTEPDGAVLRPWVCGDVLRGRSDAKQSLFRTRSALQGHGPNTLCSVCDADTWVPLEREGGVRVL